MKAANKLTLATLFLLMMACSHQSGFKTLGDDTELKKLYASNEIQELDLMVTFVDSVLLDRTGERSVETAYHRFFNECNQWKKDSVRIPFAVSDADKYAFLRQMKKPVFESIFYKDTFHRKIHYRDTVLRNFTGIETLNLRINCKFIDYLKSPGPMPEFYTKVANQIDAAGDISSATIAYFLSIHDQFNFNEPRNRLWAAVFVLRLEEPLNDKLDCYFEKEVCWVW